MIGIDVGNTRTAIGFFRDGSLVRQWQIANEAHRTADEYRHLLNEYLHEEGLTLSTVGPMVLASVVPAVTEELTKLGRDIDIHQVSAETPISFVIAIPEPSTLGADRIADLEAALRKYGAPVIIVDAGTATTVSAMNRNKEFIGGAIAPGFGISVDALFARAARLSAAPLARPTHAIGSRTDAAIESGVHFGHAALIQGLARKIQIELNEEKITTVATGGAIELLAPYLEREIIVDPTLTLEGLRYLHQNLQRTGGSNG